MTLRHLKIFAAVCDTFNMTAAAEILYISQSAVSQAIAELETFYEVRLFERLSRRLYLTAAGEKLLSYARHMIGMDSDIEKEMKAMHGSVLIRIGASVTVGANVLPFLLADYKTIKSHMKSEVIVDNTHQIETLLLNDRCDFGLVEGEIKSSELISKPFMEDRLVLVCGATHRFANNSSIKPIDPVELAKEDFIIREEGSGTRKLFEETMSIQGYCWKPAWICNNADSIKAAVIQGHGITVISQMSVKKEIDAALLYVVPIAGMNFDRTFKIIRHKNKYISEQLQTFFDFCLSYKQKINSN